MATLAARPDKRNAGAIGFIAEVLRSQPAERTRVVRLATHEGVRVFVLEALLRAGLADEAVAQAQSWGLTNAFDNLQSKKFAPIDKLTPSLDAADNDMLIHAYFASGQTERIRQVLANFGTADDQSIADAVRLGNMKGRFGDRLVPAGRNSSPAVAMCAKYACKTSPEGMERVLTLGSAFWAIGSLANRDPTIQTIFDEMFASPRMKRHLAREQAAFNDYFALTLFGTATDDAGVLDAMSAYERFASIEELRVAIKRAARR
ncbi:MAG: hypothetical protein AB7U49_00985 [Hyphomicrobiaceae bacterium]